MTVEERLERAAALQFSSPTQALELASSALHQLQNRKNSTTKAKQATLRCLAILARCYVELHDYEGAIAVGKQAIATGQEIPYRAEWACCMGLVGYAEARLGNYVEGVRYFLRQQNLAIEQRDCKNESDAYKGRGLIYSFIGDHQNALQMDMLSLEIAQEDNDLFRQAIQLNNICYEYRYLNEPDKALAYGLRGLEMCRQAGLRDEVKLLLQINLGGASIQLDMLEQAERYLKIALSDARATERTYCEMRTLMEYGRLYLVKKEYQLAIDHCECALATAKSQNEILAQYETHEILSRAYRGLGDAEKALSHYDRFYQLRSSVLNQQSHARLAELEIEHEIIQAQREADLSKLLASDLERLVQERTEALQAALDREKELAQRLEEALKNEIDLQQFKSQIIETASHEFRTPLSIISLTMDLIQNRFDALSAADFTCYRDRINAQIFYLKDMMQDVFTVNASSAIEPSYRPYNFEELCEGIKQQLTAELTTISNVHLRYPSSEQIVYTDPELLQRVIFNLTVNAIKFSAPGSPVQIAFSVEQDHFVVHVADHGIGIPQEDLNHIFAAFYRASNVSTQGGLGLGLNIVHKIVTALKGEVAVTTSVLNKGSTFCVKLPLNPCGPISTKATPL